MGIGGFSIWELMIILVIIVLLFGTKRLRNIGTDLGSAIRGFRSSVKDPEANKTEDATFPEIQQDPAVSAQSATTQQSAAAPSPAQSGNQAQDKH